MKNKETMPFIEQLLNGENVEWRKLGEVCKRTKGTKITAKEMNNIHKEDGTIKIFAGGKTYAYVNVEDIPNQDICHIPSIIVKSRGIIGFEYYDKPFSHKSEMWAYHSDNLSADIKFIYYYLVNHEYYFQRLGSKMQMPQISIPDTDRFLIPLPPLSVQHKIVEILDRFTALEAELEAELDCRKRQYEYYRNQLLSFDMLNKGGQKLNDVKIMTLGEIAKYSSTRIKSSCLCETSFVGVDNLLQDRKGKTISTHVPTEGTFAEYQVGDILIGNIRPYLKKIWYADNSGGASGDVLVIHLTNEQIMSRYLYQVLADDKFFSYNMQHAKGAKMPRGNKQKIMEYKIPLPPLSVQREIVEILDKFDTLCNSISEGLPKEIELRRKQYEYYRNQLLTFAQ